MSNTDAARQRRRRASAAQAAGGAGPELLTPVEAARLLGVGRTTIYRLATERQLTRVRIGRCARFVRAELDEFIASRLAEARRQP
jgi:excisionase family DNA binding protein